MKVKELLANLNNKSFDIEKGLAVKKYLPIALKKEIVQGILFDSIIEENGLTTYDSIDRHLSYIKYMIMYHTNLEYNEEEDYDLLCKNKIDGVPVLNILIGAFKEDAEECLKLLTMATEDYIHNNSFENKMSILMSKINNNLDDVLNLFKNKLSNINIEDFIPEDVDKKQFIDFLNTIK